MPKTFFILTGRTMEFTFDLSQTPVIGRKQIRPNMTVPPPSSASTSAASSVYGSYSVASTATLTSAMAAAASELGDKESVGRGKIRISVLPTFFHILTSKFNFDRNTYRYHNSLDITRRR